MLQDASRPFVGVLLLGQCMNAVVFVFGNVVASLRPAFVADLVFGPRVDAASQSDDEGSDARTVFEHEDDT